MDNEIMNRTMIGLVPDDSFSSPQLTTPNRRMSFREIPRARSRSPIRREASPTDNRRHNDECVITTTWSKDIKSFTWKIKRILPLLRGRLQRAVYCNITVGSQPGPTSDWRLSLDIERESEELLVVVDQLTPKSGLGGELMYNLTVSVGGNAGAVLELDYYEVKEKSGWHVFPQNRFGRGWTSWVPSSLNENEELDLHIELRTISIQSQQEFVAGPQGDV